MPSLCSTKTQNIFQVITLFAFQIPHRNTPTIAVKSQPLSTFTHCEETCPLQVRYYPKKKKRVSSSPTHHYTGRGSTASTPGAITGISCCTEPVGPQRSSEEHNFPPSLWSRSCLGYLHLLIPLTSKEAQGWCRLRHQPSSEISCSSRS